MEEPGGLPSMGSHRVGHNWHYLAVATFMAESEEELKSLLMKVKVGIEKAGLKFSMQKAKIMASGPNISWQIDRETT